MTKIKQSSSTLESLDSSALTSSGSSDQAGTEMEGVLLGVIAILEPVYGIFN